MACLAKVFAIISLRLPFTLAATCDAGSCVKEPDEVSLMQTKTVVKHGAELSAKEQEDEVTKRIVSKVGKDIRRSNVLSFDFDDDFSRSQLFKELLSREQEPLREGQLAKNDLERRGKELSCLPDMSIPPLPEVTADLRQQDVVISSVATEKAAGGRNNRSNITVKHGQKAKECELPWMAHLLMIDLVKGKQGSCSGTFIGAQHVLTAAHCFKDEDTKEFDWTHVLNHWVVIGNKIGPDDSRGTHFKIESVSLPVEEEWYKSDYINDMQGLQNDIALVKLESPIPEIVENGQPCFATLCLPMEDFITVGDAYEDDYHVIAGYGGGMNLRYGIFDVLPDELMKENDALNKKTAAELNILPFVVRGGGVEGGDSGGPLVAKLKSSNQLVIVGVTQAERIDQNFDVQAMEHKVNDHHYAASVFPRLAWIQLAAKDPSTSLGGSQSKFQKDVRSLEISAHTSCQFLYLGVEKRIGTYYTDDMGDLEPKEQDMLISLFFIWKAVKMAWHNGFQGLSAIEYFLASFQEEPFLENARRLMEDSEQDTEKSGLVKAFDVAVKAVFQIVTNLQERVNHAVELKEKLQHEAAGATGADDTGADDVDEDEEQEPAQAHEPATGADATGAEDEDEEGDPLDPLEPASMQQMRPSTLSVKFKKDTWKEMQEDVVSEYLEIQSLHHMMEAQTRSAQQEAQQEDTLKEQKRTWKEHTRQQQKMHRQTPSKQRYPKINRRGGH